MGGKRRWTSIQTDRVLLGIIAQGRLSKRRLQIAAAIISDSWAHYRKGDDPTVCNWTRDPMPVARICRLTGLDHAHVSRELRGMIEEGQVIQSSTLPDQEIRLGFNEHFDQWTVPKEHMCQKSTAYVPKEHQNGAETAPPLNVRARVTSPHLKTTVKNPRAVARAPHRDSVWDKFTELYRAENGCPPTPQARSFVGLSRIRKVHPETLILKRLAAYFAGSPEWVKPPHDFGGFLGNFDRIDGGNNQAGRPPSLPVILPPEASAAERDEIAEVIATTRKKLKPVKGEVSNGPELP